MCRMADKRLKIKADEPNSSRIRKIQEHFKVNGDLLANNSQNEIANTAMLIGLLELSRRHKIKFS